MDIDRDLEIEIFKSEQASFIDTKIGIDMQNINNELDEVNQKNIELLKYDIYLQKNEMRLKLLNKIVNGTIAISIVAIVFNAIF